MAATLDRDDEACSPGGLVDDFLTLVPFALDGDLDALPDALVFAIATFASCLPDAFLGDLRDDFRLSASLRGELGSFSPGPAPPPCLTGDRVGDFEPWRGDAPVAGGADYLGALLGDLRGDLYLTVFRDGDL